MKYHVLTLIDAENDLADIVVLLRQESPVTIPKLRYEIEQLKLLLEDFPYSYQSIEQSNLRRAFLRACRYAVYFRINTRQVEIVSVLPQLSGPDFLASRIALDN